MNLTLFPKNHISVWCHFTYFCSRCELRITQIYDIDDGLKPQRQQYRSEIAYPDKHGESVVIWKKKCPLFFPLCTFSHSFPTGIIKFNLISLQERHSHELDAIFSCKLNSVTPCFSTSSVSDILTLIPSSRSSSQRCWTPCLSWGFSPRTTSSTREMMETTSTS